MTKHDIRVRGLAALALAAIAAAGALVAAPAGAATAGLTFDRPTTYTDGTPLPVAEIASYGVRCSSFTPTGGSAGACPTVTPTSLPGTATSGTLTLAVPAIGGSACFQMQTVATNGQTSDWTAPVCRTFAPLQPNPPGNVTITVTVTVSVGPTGT